MTEYQKGFVSKCLEYGIDEKSALHLMQKRGGFIDYTDRHPVLTPVVSGGAGLLMASDPRNISKLTGTEHLFHITPKKNVGSIFESGLQVSRSLGDDTISAKSGMKDLAKDHVFLGRTKTAPRAMGGIIRDKIGPTEMLKIRIPYDELKKLNPSIDPSHYNELNFVGKSKFFRKLVSLLSPFGPHGTYALKSDVAPEFIKGSPKFDNGILKEISGMPKYIMKHPGRFAKGLGAVGGGVALMGLAGNNVARSVKRHRSKNK